MRKLIALLSIPLCLFACGPKPDPKPIDVNNPGSDAAEKIAKGQHIAPSDVAPNNGK